MYLLAYHRLGLNHETFRLPSAQNILLINLNNEHAFMCKIYKLFQGHFFASSQSITLEDILSKIGTYPDKD